MNNNYFFIGDIHGCADELSQLLQKIQASKADKIICVGDLINKGPDSNQVINILRKYNATSVMGNHDLLIKMVHDEHTQNKPPTCKIKKNVYKLYQSLSQENINFIVNLPLYIKLEEIQTIVVHGGIKPYTTLENHLPEEITSIRIVDPLTKQCVKRDKKGLPWYYFYHGAYRVIYGHTAAKSVLFHKNTIRLDTGCLYGNKLTAFQLPSEQLIYVPAKKSYVDYTQKGKFIMPR